MKHKTNSKVGKKYKKPKISKKKEVKRRFNLGCNQEHIDMINLEVRNRKKL